MAARAPQQTHHVHRESEVLIESSRNSDSRWPVAGGGEEFEFAAEEDSQIKYGVEDLRSHGTREEEVNEVPEEEEDEEEPAEGYGEEVPEEEEREEEEEEGYGEERYEEEDEEEDEYDEEELDIKIDEGESDIVLPEEKERSNDFHPRIMRKDPPAPLPPSREAI